MEAIPSSQLHISGTSSSAAPPHPEQQQQQQRREESDPPSSSSSAGGGVPSQNNNDAVPWALWRRSFRHEATTTVPPQDQPGGVAVPLLLNDSTTTTANIMPAAGGGGGGVLDSGATSEEPESGHENTRARDGVLLTLLGHAYVWNSVGSRRNSTTILSQILGATVLGAVVGTGTVLLLRLTDWVSAGWLVLYDRLLIVSVPNHGMAAVNAVLGLMAVPILGACLAGGILWWCCWKTIIENNNQYLGDNSRMVVVALLLRGAMTVDSSPRRDADDNDLEQSMHQKPLRSVLSSSLALLVANVVVMAGSFPLGPELALLAWARIATSILLAVGWRLCGRRRRGGGGAMHQQQHQQQQLWMPAAVAATMGGSGMPLAAAVVLGPLLVLELAPKLLKLGTLDSESVRLPPSNNDHDQRLEPLIHRRETLSRLQPMPHPAGSSPVWTHVATLQVVASLSAFLLRQWLMTMDLWFLGPATAIPQKHFVHLEDYHFQAWHLGLAVALGALGGLLGTFVWMLQSGWKNHCSYCWSQNNNSSSSSRTLVGKSTFCATLFAGLIQGILLRACPHASGSGLSLMQEAFASTTSSSSTVIVSSLNYDDGRLTMSTTSHQQWLVIALCRLLGLGTSMGLGLWGGPMIPMASVGLCMGLAMAYSQDDDTITNNDESSPWYYFPVSLTVPCCMAACMGSLCPAPLTITLALVLVLGCSVEEVVPVMVSSLVAWCMTGGLGWLRSLLEEKPSGGHRHPPHSTGEDDDGIHQRGDSIYDDNYDAANDDEILRSVRSAIFGSV